ncbi:MAG: PEP-CTERM sorting domain-containing protein [Vicinamibacterales bacterium]
MRKRTSVRGLVLATVNLVVILAAALIVKSLAAGNPGPSSDSFALPTDSNYALLSGTDNRPFTSGASAEFAPAASPSTTGEDPSGHVVSPSQSEPAEYPAISDLEFDPLWYGQSHSAFAPLVTGSGLWAPSGTSLGGYGSSPSATPFSRRSGWGGGGFSGAGGGGGFPSSGGGNPSYAQNSLLDSISNGGGLRSSDGTTASIAGAPLLPAQAQGNPFFAGGIPVGGPALPLVQFPGLGAGGAGALNAGGSTASVTQLQEPVSVPEPSAVLLLGCGLALAAYRRRRRP